MRRSHALALAPAAGGRGRRGRPRDVRLLAATLSALALAVALAGCTAQGGRDPFAYAKKPLYTGHFDLASMPVEGDTQQFFVDDGSLTKFRIRVFVNATEGGGRVDVFGPSGQLVVSSSATSDQTIPVDLGAWTVKVYRQPGEGGAAAGSVELLVTRS